MLTGTEHLAQGRDNEEVAQLLLTTRFTDWATTALFYAALHYVQAYFAAVNAKEIRHHEARQKAIASDAITSTIFSEYMLLMDASRAARYEGVRLSAGRIEADFTPALQRIKVALAPYL